MALSFGGTGHRRVPACLVHIKLTVNPGEQSDKQKLMVLLVTSSCTKAGISSTTWCRGDSAGLQENILTSTAIYVVRRWI